ncbi:hypothetical protein MBEHAL_1669 [Halarchaeum acidiphilum MH1-52-1]|uniref:Uncharacterized protein n=1 Tax=Halarchaeum acidiphilum MH1-52-1 TaxID=1261545 RepID=U3A5J5_9EURY|nr:hypothetical protein MBEHAL_1669 [Halarchaeum acidiphilum MH1-52-1]
MPPLPAIPTYCRHQRRRDFPRSAHSRDGPDPCGRIGSHPDS